MPIFKRIGQSIRTFGQRVFGTASPEQAAQLKREADIAKTRADAARREAEELKATIARLSPQGRRAAATQAAEREAQRQRQQVTELARRERQAREEQQRQQAREQELRRHAEEVEREVARQEVQRDKAREAFLRTRQNLPPGEWDDTFQGPRPANPKINKNRKETGAGSLPDERRFILLGEALSRFSSSNVDVMVYDYSTKGLHIKYIKSGRWYRYSVGVDVARLAYQAASKGVFTWDNLRVRGTKKGNRVPTRKDAPPPDYLPLTGSAAEFALAGGGL